MENSTRQGDTLPAYHEKDIDWIKSQPESAHRELAQSALEILVKDASQPKALSGNACLTLCKFVENSAKAQSVELRQWSYSQAVVESLFDFYVEWDESDHHRSMRLVLDVVIQLLKENPDAEAANATRHKLITNTVSIIIGTVTKPAAKSALKTLDYFLVKGVLTVDELKLFYVACRSAPGAEPPSGPELELELEPWRSFFGELFHWTGLHFVSQTAGKLMVTLYLGLRRQGTTTEAVLPIQTWLDWLLVALEKDPTLLETMKIYYFFPLFKTDSDEAIKVLDTVMQGETTVSEEDLSLDLPALLRLVVLETGKKVGLVEEPELNAGPQPRTHKASSLVLDEKLLASVLGHPSHEVRSLAISLLITTPSTTKPYSATALGLLRQHLGAYFADSDAKFRVDVMAKAREMFKRVRGAICILMRSLAKMKTKEVKARSGVEQAQQPPAAYRSNVVALPVEGLTKCLEDHTKFLRWYIGFLLSELTPTASYQRHVASLKATTWIIRMEGEKPKKWETQADQTLFFDLFDGTWARALSDLVMDSFEDVREFASANMRALIDDGRYRNFSRTEPTRQVHPADELTDLLRRAEDLARRTSRADHSDGTARLCQLVYRFSSTGAKRVSFMTTLIEGLEKKLTVASTNLAAAVLDAPVHGDFAALRFIWQAASEMRFEPDEIQAVGVLEGRIVASCECIWAVVQDILCDDSPEGHLPDELEDVDGLNTKDVLSYSFRAIHESSNLMRFIILAIRNRSKNSKGDLISPTPESFARIGHLSFQQLSSLRHRGAFATVSQTFATCCQQSKHLEPSSQGPKGDDLLDVWYKGAIAAIYAQASTTRRSAGIPSLVTGILSANAAHPAFDYVMEELINIASTEARTRETDGTRLPQVHAFNCLKDIFKNSLLTATGNKSERYLPRCLELAASGLRSEVWAIRNCGLILLRSLVDSLFGTRDSKAMIEAGWDGKANRIHYHRYQNLPVVLLNLLKSGHRMLSPTAATEPVGAEAVFPALDIIRRAGPPDALRSELQAHIAKYLASSVWHVREMAARALCSCLLHENWPEVISALLDEAVTSEDTNHVHGVLLALKFVLERLGEVAPDGLLRDMPKLSALLRRFDFDQLHRYCPDVLAAYLDIVNFSIRAYQIRWPSSSPEQLPVPTSLPFEMRSALLNIQLLTVDVYAACRDPAPISRLRDILLLQSHDVNTTIPALELLPDLFSILSTPAETLSDLCHFYIDLCLSTSATQVQAVALSNMAPVLDHLMKQARFDLLSSMDFQRLWAHLPPHSMNPSLSQAIVRASGCLVAILNRLEAISAEGIRAWGLLMAEASLDGQDFDTRFAAALSLRSFFSTTGSSCTTDGHLPALMVLYDILNDDDDEVRDIGSAAARNILGLPLVPIEAANSLAAWMAEMLGESAVFRANAAARLVGGRGILASSEEWTTADDQLNAALAFDNSLFVVEEQNLFIDEVREAKRWRQVFQALPWVAADSSLLDLDSWLTGGLRRMRRIMEQADCPLGWASNPQVFAICSRVLLGSAAITSKGYASKELLDALSGLKSGLAATEGTPGHVSGLLIGLFEEDVETFK